MRVTGAATLSAPAGTVQAALRNPDLLARAIPGCQRLDVTGAGRCQLTVTTAIAAVSGTYAGEAVIVEWQEAAGLVAATVSAAGNRGAATAGITLRLEPADEGATQVSYDIDATVTGPVADIGQRMLASIASRLAAEFLAALGRLLARPAVGARWRSRVRRPGGGAVRMTPAPRPSWSSRWSSAPRSSGGRTDAAGDRPGPAARRGAGRAVRAGVVAGGAVGLAGILIGAVLGRRNRAIRRRQPLMPEACVARRCALGQRDARRRRGAARAAAGRHRHRRHVHRHRGLRRGDRRADRHEDADDAGRPVGRLRRRPGQGARLSSGPAPPTWQR